MRLAIADPPYPPQITERYDLADGTARLVTRSRARRYYGDGPREKDVTPADFHPDAGAWDDPARHRALLEDLLEQYDGWAIATTLDGLDCYRPMPPGARTLIWRKLTSMRGGHRIETTLEAVIVWTPVGRRSRTGLLAQVPDFLQAEPSSAGFAGAKPPRWTRWILDALGYDQDEDTVADLFPGSGAVSAEVSQGVIL